MALTTLDLGDIFLTVISTQGFETNLRSINFREYWEVIWAKSNRFRLIYMLGIGQMCACRIQNIQGIYHAFIGDVAL
jgi:hypothetical protein